MTTTKRTNEQNDLLKKEKNRGKFHDPMAVTWMEKYNDTVKTFWEYIPRSVGSLIATIAVFILGASVRGIEGVIYCKCLCLALICTD